MSAPSARQEWARGWPVVIVALFGVSGSALFPYASGVLLAPMIRAFGWSRADFYSAFMLQTILGLFVTPIMGRLVDRFGPRAVALVGVPMFAAAFASLGLANGSLWVWRLHCTLLGVFTATIVPLVWVTAVVQRFQISRGLAMAVALAGVGFASAAWPLVTTLFLQAFGWRMAFAALALTWGAPVFVVTLAWFRNPPSTPAINAAEATPRAYWPALRSISLWCVVLAGGVFTTITYGLTLHLVPILQASGLDAISAASIAGLAGVFAILGRLAAGFLLDRFPARYVGVCIMALPIGVSVLLVQANGSLARDVAAVALLGLATGGETDVLAYMISRQFAQRIFASLYAVMSAVLSVGASFGPLLAGALFDANASYAPFLYLIIPAVIVSAALLWLTPKPNASAIVTQPASA